MLFDDLPAAGATVRLTDAVMPAGATSEMRIVADAAGRFDFGPQPAARIVLVAERPHLTGAVLAIDLRDPTGPAPEDLRLVLHACTASLHGTVHDMAKGVIPHSHVAWGHNQEVPRLEAIAGDDGAYELCVPPGFATASASADGYATFSDSVSAFGPVRRDFALVPEALVQGRVVRASDRTPVANATVQLTSTGRAFGAVPLYATSDEDGRFHFDGAMPGAQLLSATAEGLATEQPVDVIAEVGRVRDEIVCVLVPAPTVSGKIVESDGGAPVAGIAIRLLTSGRIELRSLDAVSQTDGSFTIERVLPGDYKAFIGFDRTERAKITVHKTDLSGVVVEMESLGSVSGRVLHHGKGIDGAVVSTLGATTTSNQDGSFTLRAVAGSHELYAESQREGAFTRGPTIVLEKHETKTGVDLVLGLEASVSGSVVDQDGAPVAGAVVAFSLLHGKDFGTATSADDGTFTARAMAGGGEYMFEVRRGERAGTYPPADGKPFPPIAVNDGTTRVTGLRISIRVEHLVISGRVLDAEGNPVPDVAVRAVPAGGRWYAARSPSSSTDTSGAFTIRDLATGNYDVFATRGEGDEPTSNIAAGRTDVVIRLSELGSIDGTLVGFTDPPLIFAMMESRTSGFRRGVVTGDTFRIRDLPIGTYNVMARANTSNARASVVVTKGVAAKVTLELQPRGTIAGTVLDEATRAPLSGIPCMTHVDGASDSAGYAMTGSTGTYEIRNATPGVNSVSCGGAAPREVVVAADKPASADFTIHAPARAYTGMRLEQQFSKVLVQTIDPGGPAERAGLAIGDLVQQIDGYPIANTSTATYMIDRHVGASIKLTIERAGKQQVVQLAVEAAK